MLRVVAATRVDIAVHAHISVGGSLSDWSFRAVYNGSDPNGRETLWARADRLICPLPFCPNAFKKSYNMTFQIAKPDTYQRLSRRLKQLAAAATVTCALVVSYVALSPQALQASIGANDKTLHVFAFIVLVLPCATFLARSLVWVLPLIVMFGAAIEFLQPGFGRHASWSDFYADLVGIAVGVVLGLTLRFLIKRFVAAQAPKGSH